MHNASDLKYGINVLYIFLVHEFQSVIGAEHQLLTSPFSATADKTAWLTMEYAAFNWTTVRFSI